MNKSLSFGAIAALVFMAMAMAMELSGHGYDPGGDIRFEHPDRISASIANYNRMVEREQFLATVRDKYLSFRDHKMEWSLNKGPGDTTQRSHRPLDQPF